MARRRQRSSSPGEYEPALIESVARLVDENVRNRCLPLMVPAAYEPDALDPAKTRRSSFGVALGRTLGAIKSKLRDRILRY